MVEPDPLKIKYREALIQSVQAVVKGVKRPGRELIAQLSVAYAEEADRPAFTELLMTALQQLHEGSIARYRLRRSEYLAWQNTQSVAGLAETVTRLAVPTALPGR